MYQPYTQVTDPTWLNHVTFVVRSTADAGAVASLVRTAVRNVDPQQAPPDIVSMPDVIRAATLEPEFQTWLVISFAVMALGLTLVGIYGVLAYAVSRRTREFGVRIALGATSGHVLGIVLRRAVWLTIVGVVLGVSGALVASRLLSAFLFEITPTDPVAFFGAIALVMLTALAASAIPAWRATRVNPTTALRTE